MDSKTLSGKTALVTGASGGIGAAISRALASAGASVAVHYHSGSQRAEELVEELKSMGVKAVALRTDLCEASEIESLFERAEAELGPLDILVNNAGVGTTGNLAETEVNELDRLINVNFRAVALTLRQAATRLSEGGTVINISSMLGDHPLPGTTTYAATKAAVDLLSRGAARELGERGISVKSLSPGATIPGMFGESPKERQDAFAADTPLGRIGRAEDIGATVAFLVSESGRWINGTVVTADGGYSA